MTDVVDEHSRGMSAATGIALIGYRATGKSTVGRLLATRLDRAFVDVDCTIMRESRLSISAIFESSGEAMFRRLEGDAIARLTRLHRGGILATGGGAVLSESNRRALRDFGVVVWLTAPAETLISRLHNDRESPQRPALTEAGLFDEVATVLEAREPLYRECADLIVDTSVGEPGVVVEEIVRLLPSARKGVRR